MGTYFLSLSIGSFIASQLAKLTSVKDGLSGDPTELALASFNSSFKVFAAIGIGAGVLLFAVSARLRARMHEGVG